jgi:hypothetical protein
MPPLSDAPNMVSGWKSTLRKRLKKAGIKIPPAAAADETSSQWTASEPPAIHKNNDDDSSCSTIFQPLGNGKGFLFSLGITDPTKFLNADPGRLGEQLITWRESNNMAPLVDAVNIVHCWRSLVRKKLREAKTGISSAAQVTECFTPAEHSAVDDDKKIGSYASCSTIILDKLWAGGTEFLLSQGIKDPHQFLSTPTKALSVHVNAWRKSQGTYPIGTPEKAIARWKSQVRKKLKAAGLPTSGSLQTDIQQNLITNIQDIGDIDNASVGSNILDNLTGYGTDFLRSRGITDPVVFMDTPTKDLSEHINKWRHSQNMDPVGDPLNLVHRWRMIVRQRIQEAEAENSAYAGDVSDLASSNSDLLQGLGWITDFVAACGITTPEQLLATDTNELEKGINPWRKSQNMNYFADTRRETNKLKAVVRERLEQAGFPLPASLEANLGMQQQIMVADADDDTLYDECMPLISSLSKRFINKETGLPVYEFAVRSVGTDGKFKWFREYLLHSTRFLSDACRSIFTNDCRCYLLLSSGYRAVVDPKCWKWCISNLSWSTSLEKIYGEHKHR